GALLESGGHHVDEQAGIVELSIVINRAAAQAFGLECRQMFERLFSGKNARGSKPVLTGEQLIELQAETVERSLPPVIIRHDEREIAHQVGSVLQKQSALFERFHDQPNIALLQVADAPVRQLGAAAGSALA